MTKTQLKIIKKHVRASGLIETVNWRRVKKLPLEGCGGAALKAAQEAVSVATTSGLNCVLNANVISEVVCMHDFQMCCLENSKNRKTRGA